MERYWQFYPDTGDNGHLTLTSNRETCSVVGASSGENCSIERHLCGVTSNEIRYNFVQLEDVLLTYDIRALVLLTNIGFCVVDEFNFN